MIFGSSQPESSQQSQPVASQSSSTGVKRERSPGQEDIVTETQKERDDEEGPAATELDEVSLGW
jgi:hypothetical protein